MQTPKQLKQTFQTQLDAFTKTLKAHLLDEANQWTIKGFIDVFQHEN